MLRTIHKRIGRLEVINNTDDICHTCGAPATLAPAYVITPDLAPLEKCRECARTLNLEGNPLPKHYKRLILPREFGNPIRDAKAPHASLP